MNEARVDRIGNYIIACIVIGMTLYFEYDYDVIWKWAIIFTFFEFIYYLFEKLVHKRRKK